MDEILARAGALGVQAEVLRITSRETSVEFENNRLKRVETAQRAGIAVRVIAHGHLGFATSSEPADESGLLNRAITTAAFGKQVSFAFPGPCGDQAVEIKNRAVARLTPEEMVLYGEDLIGPMRAANPKFKAAVSLTAARAQASLANTSGFAGATSKTIFGGSVGGILVEGENFLELAEGHFSCRRTDVLRPLRDRVVTHLGQSRHNAPFGSGKYRVLFTPVAHAALLGPILACLNGKAVEKGSSPFRDRLGVEVFSPLLTLLDDPLLAYFPATAPYDGEGMPSARTILIERGVLRNFYVDLDTAAALGLKPNANGRRGGWTAPPAPGPSTIVVASPGDEPSSRLLAGLDEGLLVHCLMGANQGNPYGGVISANIMLGFVVRRGEIVGRVKNTMLAVNVFDLLRSQLVCLSGDREEVGGAAILPYLLADGVSG